MNVDFAQKVHLNIDSRLHLNSIFIDVIQKSIFFGLSCLTADAKRQQASLAALIFVKIKNGPCFGWSKKSHRLCRQGKYLWSFPMYFSFLNNVEAEKRALNSLMNSIFFINNLDCRTQRSLCLAPYVGLIMIKYYNDFCLDPRQAGQKWRCHRGC